MKGSKLSNFGSYEVMIKTESPAVNMKNPILTDMSDVLALMSDIFTKNVGQIDNIFLLLLATD